MLIILINILQEIYAVEISIIFKIKNLYLNFIQKKKKYNQIKIIYY